MMKKVEAFVRHDTGNPAGWLAANVQLALTDPTYGPALRELAASILAEG